MMNKEKIISLSLVGAIGLGSCMPAMAMQASDVPVSKSGFGISFGSSQINQEYTPEQLRKIFKDAQSKIMDTRLKISDELTSTFKEVEKSFAEGTKSKEAINNFIAIVEIINELYSKASCAMQKLWELIEKCTTLQELIVIEQEIQKIHKEAEIKCDYTLPNMLQGVLRVSNGGYYALTLDENEPYIHYKTLEDLKTKYLEIFRKCREYKQIASELPTSDTAECSKKQIVEEIKKTYNEFSDEIAHPEIFNLFKKAFGESFTSLKDISTAPRNLTEKHKSEQNSKIKFEKAIVEFIKSIQTSNLGEIEGHSDVNENYKKLTNVYKRLKIAEDEIEKTRKEFIEIQAAAWLQVAAAKACNNQAEADVDDK